MNKENLTIKALNMYGKIPEQWELLEEIERLNKDLETAIDICNQRQKEIVRLANIINKLEKYLEEKRCYEDLVILDKLKALKEGKE